MDHDQQTPGTPRFGDELLRAVLETAVNPIITTDTHGIIVSANVAAERLFQYRSDQLIGANVSLIVPEPHRSRHDDYMRRYLETGEAKVIGIGREVEGQRRDGSRVPLHLSVSTFDVGGKRFFTGLLHDLSERKAYESELVRQQTLFRSIFNAAPDALIITDQQRQITVCSPSVRGIFGYDVNELLGQPASLLFARPEDVARLIWEGSAAEQSSAAARLDAPFRHKSGATFPGEVVCSTIRDPDGVALGFLGLFRDQSKEVQQQEALFKAQRMEALGQLTGGIAHDFNNLLTVIIGNHELLEGRLAEAGALELLKEAQDAAEMGARLTDRLLTFARRRRLEPAILDLNDQVLGMSELLRRALGEAIDVSTVLSPALWRVRVDPSEIENAILNLAVNARDAMPKGGKLVIETHNDRIDAATAAGELGLDPGDFVRLSVSDNGVGMTKEVLARVFEPFFTTKGPGRGTGLGLSTLYGFVKQSGGRVAIYSEPEQGTTVNIYLPRADADAIVVPPAGGGTTPLAAGEKVLVVEDNEAVRRLTVRRVKSLGYRVIEAEHGPQALGILAGTSDIDIVLTDVVMPGGMSGVDLAERIGKAYPAIAVLLTSGFAEDIIGSERLQADGLRLLRKPYGLPELAQALRDVVRERH
jgi:PAS domain S-box-containing protein